jgi:hypothetical protein
MDLAYKNHKIYHRLLKLFFAQRLAQVEVNHQAPNPGNPDASLFLPLRLYDFDNMPGVWHDSIDLYGYFDNDFQQCELIISAPLVSIWFHNKYCHDHNHCK